MSKMQSLMLALGIAMLIVGTIGCSGEGNDGAMVCGDGVVDAGEECDDGNTNPDDGCDASCLLECGNGVLNGMEVCDDGNDIDTDECSNSCLLAMVTTVCGLTNPSGIFCSGDCTFNHDEYANWYCQLGGFNGAASFTVLDTGNVQCPFYDAGVTPVLTDCSELSGPSSYGLSATCDAVTDLVCN
jgi:cysteine-rich repeat protein